LDRPRDRSIPFFLQEFDVTNNIDDKMSLVKYRSGFKIKKLGITMKKLGMELKPYLLKNHFDKVENKVVSVNGMKFQAWVGVKRL
jgi:hypothetical protein